MAVFTGCSDPAGAERPATPIITSRAVSAEPVVAGPLLRAHRFSGVVRAADRASLTFTLSGRVTSRPAQIGDTVRAGDVLASLDRRPLRNALAAARARKQTLETQLAQARRDSTRSQRLREAQAIGAEELEKTTAHRDTLTAQLAAAAADVSEASRMLGEATLRAPFAGTVIDVLVEPGEFAQAGRPAILISGERRAEVEVEIPDGLRRSIQIGDAADVRFPLTDTATTTGRLDRLGRASAGAGRLLPVIIELPASVNAVAGQTAEVTLRTTIEDVISIPVASVVDPSGSRPAVFRVEDAIATLVPLELGAIVGDRVVVKSGIAAGDIIVTAGHANLVSGESLEVIAGVAGGAGK